MELFKYMSILVLNLGIFSYLAFFGVWFFIYGLIGDRLSIIIIYPNSTIHYKVRLRVFSFFYFLIKLIILQLSEILFTEIIHMVLYIAQNGYELFNKITKNNYFKKTFRREKTQLFRTYSSLCNFKSSISCCNTLYYN